MKVDSTMEKVGIIPFQTQRNKLAVLFVTSQTRGRWILPKGTVKKKETPIETCHREGFEESGVKGTVLEQYPITVVVGRQTENGLEHNPVTYYPFLVTSQEDDFPEMDKRKRHWALIDDAPKVTYREDFSQLIQIIKDLKPWLIEAGESSKS